MTALIVLVSILLVVAVVNAAGAWLLIAAIGRALTPPAQER